LATGKRIFAFLAKCGFCLENRLSFLGPLSVRYCQQGSNPYQGIRYSAIRCQFINPSLSLPPITPLIPRFPIIPSTPFNSSRSAREYLVGNYPTSLALGARNTPRNALGASSQVPLLVPVSSSQVPWSLRASEGPQGGHHAYINTGQD
jgi:hypothetical protein